MTVIELINELKKFPENMDVFVGERQTDFDFGLVNSCSIQEIDFTEEPGEEVLSRDKVVVLSEE